MKKKFIFWWALAAVLFFIDLQLFLASFRIMTLLAGFVWAGVCIFVGYRRWCEYQEQKAEYDARMRAMDAVTRSAEEKHATKEI